MKALVINNNQCYALHSNMDVHDLKNNFKTPAMLDVLFRTLEKVSVAECDTKRIYKYEDGKWYFLEPSFKVWECANDYVPQPHLDAEVQYELMKRMK